MALLSKIKSATLLEALIATVLIIVIFMVAATIMNTVMYRNALQNTHQVDCRLNQLDYQCRNNMIGLPYSEDYNEWHIEIKAEYADTGAHGVVFNAEKDGKKNIQRVRFYEK
jgi:Tfp pilus assembly protein PilV